MFRDSIILKLIVLAFAATIILMMAFQMLCEGPLALSITEFDALYVLVDKRYSKSSGTLVVSLQNLGKPVNSITKEDFKWYLDDCAMGIVYSVYFVEGRIGRWDKGEIIHIELKTARDISGGKIKLAFRDSSIEFSV